MNDTPLSDIPAEEFANVSAIMEKLTGVTIANNGGNFTLRHTASGSVVVKPAGLTLSGPAAVRDEPADRFSHASRAQRRF